MFSVNKRRNVSFEAGLALITIAINLERIADLSMNIAEETLYVVEGSIVKHRSGDHQPAW